MALDLKSDRVHELARELADSTDSSMTSAVEVASREASLTDVEPVQPSRK